MAGGVLTAHREGLRDVATADPPTVTDATLLAPCPTPSGARARSRNQSTLVPR